MQNGGLDPLIDLVESHAESLQHNAAFALYGLADNPDNIAGIIKAGGAQRLQNAELIAQVKALARKASFTALSISLWARQTGFVLCYCVAWANREDSSVLRNACTFQLAFVECTVRPP